MRPSTKKRSIGLGPLAGLVVVLGFGVWGLAAAIAGSGGAPHGEAPAASASAPSPAASVGERFPNFWPDPPPADVRALLDGLGPGTALTGGWSVRGISPPQEQRIVIDVARGEAGFRVWVTRKGGGSGAPPAQTERYALFSVQPRPEANSVSSEDLGRVLEAVAERIRRTEQRVPAPRGL